MKTHVITTFFFALTVLVLAAPALVHADCPEDCDGDGENAFDYGGRDCDDDDADRLPLNAEVCDAVDHDEDCDPTTYGHHDADGDGFDDAACCNFDEEGNDYCGDDCDDQENGVHPIASEVCNGYDDDCNGLADEHLLTSFYSDADGDGFGEGSAEDLCPGNYSGLAGNDADCDDANAAIIPGAQVCAGAATVDICAADAGFVAGGRCSTGQVCAAQPNGTGLCVEQGPGRPVRP